MNIEEEGTTFAQEIEIDVSQRMEIFRVPSHNDVEGADYYHDFKKVSVWSKHNNRIGILLIKSLLGK